MSLNEYLESLVVKDNLLRVCADCKNYISNKHNKPVTFSQELNEMLEKKYTKSHGLCVDCYEKALRSMV